MASKKGSIASKTSKEAGPSGQQNLFHFYKKQPKSAARVANAKDLSSASMGIAPESEPLSPTAITDTLPDADVLSSKPFEMKEKHHPLEMRASKEGNAQVVQKTNETRVPSGSLAIGSSMVGAHTQDVELQEARKILRSSQQQPPSRPSTAVTTSQKFETTDADHPNTTVFREEDVSHSGKLFPKQPYPLFEKRRVTSSSQSTAGRPASSSKAFLTIPTMKPRTKKSPALHDVVDLTSFSANGSFQSTPKTSTVLEKPTIIIIDDEPVPQATLRGSQNAPIDLSSSPPVENQPTKPLHPFFVGRAMKRKDTGCSRPGAIESDLQRMNLPWPNAEAQHTRGPQTCFRTSGSPPFGNFPRSSRSSSFSSSPTLRFLDNPVTSQPLFSESRIEESRLHRPIPVERQHVVLSLPSSHRMHPGISRLLHDGMDIRPTSTLDKGETWTQRWRPRRAAELLGNEDNAGYLKAWLHALEIRAEVKLSTRDHGIKGKSILKGSRGMKRPTVVRAVMKKRGRKRRRVESDDESSSGDWIVDDEEEEELESGAASDDEVFLRQRLTIDKRLSGSSESTPARHSDAQGIKPSGLRSGSQSPEFPHLTNTILLTGPHGSGKTSTVYACAEELGWEVFEVYPGVGKRTGSNITSLIGDLGKNHLVGSGGVHGTDWQRRPTQVTGEDKDDASGNEDSKRAIRQSVILLEEVDVLFKEDVNFWPTVINIIKSSRRPVIITCNDISLVPREDLPLQTCLVFQPCPSPLAVSFLQCVCLAEGHFVPRKQLEAMYGTTYEPIGSDEPDEPQVPYSSEQRPCPDLRRILNSLQFLCQRRIPELPDDSQTLSAKIRPPTEVLEITTNSWTEILADWSRAPVVLHGSSTGQTSSQAYSVNRLWKHAEYGSYTDAYLERRSWDVLEGLAIDRFVSTLDDEVGYTLLDKAIANGRSSSMAFYNQDERFAHEILAMSRHVLETSGAGPRARTSLRGGVTHLDARSLVAPRMAAHLAQVGSFLDKLIEDLAAPRPAVVLEYAPYVRQMVAADDVMEADTSAMNAIKTQGRSGRLTRNSWPVSEYPRYITLPDEGLKAARTTMLTLL